VGDFIVSSSVRADLFVFRLRTTVQRCENDDG